MGKQHLDLFTPSSAHLLCRNSHTVWRVTSSLGRVIVSQRGVSAGLADRTAATDFCSASIPFDLGVLVRTAQFQLKTFEAGIATTLRVILEVAEVVFTHGLVFAVQHRNMRCDLAFQQPRQKWPPCRKTYQRRSDLVGSHAVWHCVPAWLWWLRSPAKAVQVSPPHPR